MSATPIQIYPEGSALKTEERKQLHATILEHVHLGEFKKKEFIPALKRLFFEGQIESFDERILDPGELIRRINPLGTHVHAYICLASPVVSEEFFGSILQRYKPAAIAEMGVDVVQFEEFWGDSRPLGPDLYARLQCLVRATRPIMGESTFLRLSGRMFKKFVSRVCYGRNTATCLVADWWETVDQFIGSQPDLENTRILATRLLSGCPESLDAYQDVRFLQFCERYFSRDFGPHLLAFLDDVYHAVPEGWRIRLENGAIVTP